MCAKSEVADNGLFSLPTNQTILVTPLNWGLGHATRLCPIINRLISRNNTIILAGNGASLKFLQTEFPQLTVCPLRAFTIKYPAKGRVFWAIFLQMPLFWLNMVTDYWQTAQLVKKMGIGTIISDNRYGCHHTSTTNLLITHQLFLPLPRLLKWASIIVNPITRWLVSRFNQCWVPDYEEVGHSLAGALSHGTRMPKNVVYCGPLSRFLSGWAGINELNLPAPQVVVLVSGPNPFRQKFIQTTLKKYANTPQTVVMVLGNMGHTMPQVAQNITIFDHVTTPQLAWLLRNAQQVEAIAGYTTIMDLHCLEVKAHLIATPGQPEQEYLVQWHRGCTSKSVGR